MKPYRQLLRLLFALRNSPGLQLMAAEFVGIAADATPRSVIKAGVAQGKADTEKDETETPDLAVLVGKCAYETERGSYFVEDKPGERWLKLLRIDFLLFLEIVLGFLRKASRGEVAPADLALNHVQRNCGVDLALELGGLPAGVHVLNGTRILVPVKRMPLPGADGDASAAINFLQVLLGRGQDELWGVQWVCFVAWLKWWREAMTTRLHRPRQFLGLYGPVGCGKSATQGQITQLCGGRMADGGMFLSGDTDFNAEMWNSDHIILSDATLSERRPGMRRQLRDKIKEMIANPNFVYHPKGKTLRTLPHRWGVTMSANNDEASATIIPEVDESTADKFTYLRGYSPTEPFPAAGTPAGDVFWGAIQAALPAFAKYVDEFTIPADVADPRWGFKAWRHPEIMALIEQANPDADVGGLLDGWLAGLNEESVSKSAADLYADLNGALWPTFDKTCRSPLVLGQALHRLSSVTGWKGRISSEVIRKGEGRQPQTIWTLRKVAAAECQADPT